MYRIPSFHCSITPNIDLPQRMYRAPYLYVSLMPPVVTDQTPQGNEDGQGAKSKPECQSSENEQAKTLRRRWTAECDVRDRLPEEITVREGNDVHAASLGTSKQNHPINGKDWEEDGTVYVAQSKKAAVV